jgi:hypothetical protein
VRASARWRSAKTTRAFTAGCQDAYRELTTASMPHAPRSRPYRSAERGRTRTNRRIIPPFELSDNEVPRRQPRRWPAEPRGRTAGVRVSAEGSRARNSLRAASPIPTNHMTVGDEVQSAGRCGRSDDCTPLRGKRGTWSGSRAEWLCLSQTISTISLSMSDCVVPVTDP